jgi:uncharacterized protein YehS (DUF1456 family)
MTNNDIMRRIRYIFDFSDSKMIKVFGLAECDVTRAQISDWMKKDDDPAYVPCTDHTMATFLNGLICEKRGKREGPAPVPEKQLTNNLILRKLKIALALQSHEMLDILSSAGLRLSEHELSAFFRKPEHKHFRRCQDQVLRNFLAGLVLKHRPDSC